MKKFIYLALFISISLNLCSQNDGFYGTQDPSAKQNKKLHRQQKLERWSFGGNFWVSFGSSAYVEVSPVIMYKATPRFMIGPGFTFIYYKNEYFTYDSSLNRNYYYHESAVYGPRMVATYTLFKDLNEKININLGNIILHGEYEYLNVDEVADKFGQPFLTGDKIWISNLLLGGGIYQPLGQRGGISFMVLYNFLENNNSAYNYSNPIIRLGFYF